MNRRTSCGVALAVVLVSSTGCETDGTSKSNDKQTVANETEQTEAKAKSKQKTLGPGPYAYRRSIGSKGKKPGQFREPVGLAVGSNGNVYVPDTHNKRLQKLSPTGESLEVWAEGIERPMHIAFGQDGRLLVPVFQTDEVRIFDGPSDPVQTFGGDWLDAPAGVAQGPEGKFYVADFYNHRFHVVSEEGERQKTVGYLDGLRVVGEDGERLDEVGKKGKKKPGQFTYPTDVAVEPDGTIWIADAYAHRIQVYSPKLKHRRTIGGWGKERPGKFRVATGIDVGPKGKLYVADFQNNRVQVLEPDGTPVAVIEGEKKGDGALKLPTEVVRTKSKLYVTDHGHHQIDVYTVGGGEQASE
jgi:DNA-binding beta-propeller fold protein YncE